ncbi:MAG: hypothetical protein F4X45_00115, partial [Chloroflexi bacterium]|nr:hypothetical protein [Chloroflexota bacterium]
MIRTFWEWRVVRILGLGMLFALLAFAQFFVPARESAAQSTTTVTLSVPADAKFEEGRGSTTVTVTATLSATRSSATVIDLSLGGTAKTTDYTVVGSLPDITVAAGQRTGTAYVTLDPVDDNFLEGKETVRIGGAATGVTVNAVDVPLEDNDKAPTLELMVDHAVSGTYYEGDTVSARVTAQISEGGIFEEDQTVQLAPVYNRATASDFNFGDNPPPWDLTLSKGKTSGALSLTFTIVDDTEAESDANMLLEGSLTFGGVTSQARKILLSIRRSDLPISASVQCSPRPSYAGDTITCRPYIGNGPTTRDYTVTATFADTAPVTPKVLTFSVETGSNGQLSDKEKPLTWDADAVGKTVSYTVTISPDDLGEQTDVQPRIGTYPAADASYIISNYEFVNYPTGFSAIIELYTPIVFVVEVPRPAEIVGTPRMDVELDSGTVQAECDSISATTSIYCLYLPQVGDYDFDGEIAVPADAVKFTGWRDARDTSVSGSVANPLPATRMTHPTPGMRIYGGTHPIDLLVSPQSVQEGPAQPELTVTAVNRNEQPHDADLVIPLTFVDISTNPNDYLVSGTRSVTIPAGQREGTTTLQFTAVDDLVRERDTETVRIEGPKGAMETPFVRGADLNVIDAAGITLSVAPVSLAENRGATQVSVTAAWGDAADGVVSNDVAVALTWGGSAGSADYTRSGGATVTIPANARSGTVTATITPTDDNLLEGDETIEIAGTAPGRSVAATELTLTDDETIPQVTLAVSPTTLSEGDAATTVTVSAALAPEVRSPTHSATVTLDLAGTATQGADYTAAWSPANKQITIPINAIAGSNTVTLTLTPSDDDLAEGQETIVVQGTATLGSDDLVVQVATVTMTDDDTKGVNVSPATLTVAEGATGTYQVWLGTQPTADVTVSLSPSDATVAAVSPKELTFTLSNWSEKQPVTVSGVQDDRRNVGDQRTATIKHTAGGGGYDGVEKDLAVTVTDDDAAPTSVALSASPTGVGEEDGA